MTQNAILFIPDISGFTEFVHYTDISHSRHIISELLELLIDTNPMGMDLAEIEGDALFLFKIENKVDISLIEQQIEAMYMAFHTHLKRYQYQRICHCGACSSAYNLKLKFVVHYGEIEFIKVKDSQKPYGSHVIQAHRLLKNNVPIDEYAIFTEKVLPIEKGNKQQLKATYDFGDISFTYNALSHLKEHLPEIDPIPSDVPKHSLIKETFQLNMPALDLYEILSNFDYRLLWVKGVDKLEYEKNKVNRAGLKHKCIINNKEINQVTLTKKVTDGQLVYGETTTDMPFTKRLSNYFILKEIKEGITKVDVEVFADFTRFGIIMKPYLKNNLKKAVSENFRELNTLIKSGFTAKPIQETV